MNHTQPLKIEFSAFLEALPKAPRLRLAPTPSGFLHVGNALNFTLNWLAARSKPAGKLLLRIDDLDAERKRPEFLEDIFQTLDWLGFEVDEGPSSPDDFERNWSQHRRLDLYETLLNSLKIKNLVFADGFSRKELADGFPPDFRSQNRSLDEPNVAWRMKTPPDFLLPNFLVRGKNGLPSYQIASLADDVFFKINGLVRGADLTESTAAQRFLAEKTGLDSFLLTSIFHHALLKNESGEKLSKSTGADSVRAMRAAGLTRRGFFEKIRGWLDEATRAVLMEKMKF